MLYFTARLLLISTVFAAVDLNTNDGGACRSVPVEVIILVDSGSHNNTHFNFQQQKLLKTVRYILTSAPNRDVRFGVISFNETPTTLLELASPFARDTKKVSSLLASLYSEEATDVSVAKALDAATQQFKRIGNPTSQRIIVIAHDGINTDLVAETVDAVSKMEESGAHLFAVSSNTQSNLHALLGYTGDKTRIFNRSKDKPVYHRAIKELLESCSAVPDNMGKRGRAFGIRSREVKKSAFNYQQKCGTDKADVMIVLDTSGSVYSVFEQQRNLALQFLRSMPAAAFNERLQISLVRFAADAEIVIRFSMGRSRDDIISTVENIKFTGQNTRIASAVDLAIGEIERARRKDAKQIFILISDGHGQEYWNIVQSTGKRLQDLNTELFAVSASADYNEIELLIYVGEKSRLFVGPTSLSFIPTVSTYVHGCVGAISDEEKAQFSNSLLQKPERPVTSNTEKPDGTKISHVDITTIQLSTRHPETPSTTLETSTATRTTTTPTTTEDTVEITGLEAEEENISTVITQTPSTTARHISTTSITSTPKSTTERRTTTSATTTTTKRITTRTTPSVVLTTVDAIREASEPKDNDEGSGIDETVEEDKTKAKTASINKSNHKNFEPPKKEQEVSPALVSNEHRERAIVEAADPNCLIDLVFIVDRSQSVSHDFEAEITIATEILERFSDSAFASGKIRVGAVSFARDARVEHHLQTGSRTVAVKAIQRIQHTGGTTSSVTGANLAIDRLLSRRRQAAKLVVLLLTDGHSQDYWRNLIQTAQRLRGMRNSVLYAYTASKSFSLQELLTWTGSEKNVFVNGQGNAFLKTVEKEVGRCVAKEEREEKTVSHGNSIPSREIADNTRNGGNSVQRIESIISKTTIQSTTIPHVEVPDEEMSRLTSLLRETPVTQSTTRKVGSQAVKTTTRIIETTTSKHVTTQTMKTVIAQTVVDEPEQNIENEDVKVHGIRTATALEKIDETGGESDLSTGCRVDLIFIIDTSTSVESEFQRQLQFAVDLVKRLPSEDFESRVRIGVITFHSKATLRLGLGELVSRTAIVDALLAIEHSGGSTSVSSGVELAVNHINTRRRKNAKLMVVLVSDGNSQDHWNEVIKSSTRLRSTAADVFAVTVSQKYMLRELELYAGNRWQVYIDARIRQFLKEAEHYVIQCETQGDKLVELTTKSPAKIASNSSCDSVDLVLVIDTSASVADEFYEEKQLAIDLVKSIPGEAFKSRLSVSIVSFASTASVVLPLNNKATKEDILFELERLPHTGGVNSLATATRTIVEEVKAHHRSSARLHIIIVSDGNSYDEWDQVKASASSLHSLSGRISTVSLSDKYYLDELIQYAQNEHRVFVGGKSDSFIQAEGTALLECKLTEKIQRSPNLAKLREDNANVIRIDLSKEVDEELERKRCNYNKIDLQIILDASSSREDVFEHQRELALSLIERLPISSEGAHVAVGINSFTSVPTLRQTLGLGRNKKMVRAAIEGITYNGGSTLTAQAVELSVDDLARGRREDAVQVVVLMNDGLSQDPWDKVLKASKRLADAKVERFGVALGNQVDLRELRRYIGNDARIYRDGSTEKFLTDVVSLLKRNTDCSDEDLSAEQDLPEDCPGQNLDLVVLFDNTDKSPDMSDPAINANRYLLLDVLGSLVGMPHVKVAVIGISGSPRIEMDFTGVAQRDRVFAKIEAIKTLAGTASYADGISYGLNVLRSRGRPYARSALLIVGDGVTKDSKQAIEQSADRIRQVRGLNCYAVDSSMHTDKKSLRAMTGHSDKVYDYERNAEFAKKILSLAKEGACQKRVARERVFSAVTAKVETTTEWVYSTPKNDKDQGIRMDILGEPIDVDKDNEIKVVKKKTTLPVTTRLTTTTSRSTTPSTTTTRVTRRSTTERSTTSPRPLTTATTTIPRRITQEFLDEPQTTYKPGCLMDIVIVLDSSGSVEDTFRREKELAAEIIEKLRIGSDNARISIIKFAAPEKVKTVWGFNDVQSKPRILRALAGIHFSSGTTAIHSALLQAIEVYSEHHGARPGKAPAIAIIFTDGFGYKPTAEEAMQLRKKIPNTFAVAINHNYPISRHELEIIAGSPARVFTDANIQEFHKVLDAASDDCILD